ncbi:MAG TPA: SDR family oxidoreductase [Pyrinomonadaceae bacterium]|jgi:NAD(P)-dependent dehydrogenase (short-subunit alcohol dehydrogenase family)|nr:SDR family oxidoreductase [Pyrinomonadaceae bacterium]
MNRLQGKNILITGASRGLGRSLAIEYAREGAAALSLVARSSGHLKEVSERVREAGPATRLLLIEADLQHQEEIERVVATTLSEFGGRLDVLVNNASAIGPTPLPYLLDYPLEDFRSVLDTNLIAPFLLIKKALPAMVEHGGSIINVTSDAGQTGYPGWGAYGISKFGLEGMSQTWAAELDGSDVRINVVDPGEMNTAMHRAAEPEEDPNQWASPEEVTEVFVYLASDESRHLNGQRFQAQEENWGRKEGSNEGKRAEG